MHSVRQDIFKSWLKFMPEKRMPERNMLRYNRLKQSTNARIRSTAIEKMITGNMALIPLAVTRYGQKSAVLDDDDFFQTCVEAMRRAVVGWEPEKGKFSGYFLIWAQQMIDRQIAQLSREIAIKPDVLVPYRKLKRAMIDERCPTPLKPDDMEAGDYEKALMIIGQRFINLDYVSDDFPLISDRVGSISSEPDDFDSVHSALKKLNDREKIIVESLYGIGTEKKTMKELAEILCVSHQRINQIEKICRVKIKHWLNKNPG